MFCVVVYGLHTRGATCEVVVHKVAAPFSTREQASLWTQDNVSESYLVAIREVEHVEGD